MGGDHSKLNFRNTVIKLTTRTQVSSQSNIQPVDATDDAFWNQFWDEYPTTTQDIFVLIPAAEIRALREESPNNLATLCYKSVERLAHIAENSFPNVKQQQSALNCIRLLTRLLPYIFEDTDWRAFFWSAVPSDAETRADGAECVPLAHTLLTALCDLLFCPGFTISSNAKLGLTNDDEFHTVDSCEHIWQAGVGFAQTPPSNAHLDSNRAEILKLLLTCFSETMYLTQSEAHSRANRWVAHFCSLENRHALPLFASLLNVLCAYDPVGMGLPYNYLVFNDAREPLVEAAAHILCIVLENDSCKSKGKHHRKASDNADHLVDSSAIPDVDNLFLNYMSRIHRDEDFGFILSGISRLLNNPLIQTYLPGSTKRVQMHQELLILFWRMCDVNRKFMYYVLKSAHVLDILVPVLYHLNDARSDQSRLGLVHIGVFILLLLSGERNFGVRLNKPYNSRVPMDITVFTGTHADLLIIVFHKVITTGHQRLQPLFDCLLTIIVNMSPYVKTLSMVSATKLVHLLEAFSQTWFLYANAYNHQLTFYLLEIFNNIIQYQFDGNSNLVYTLIRKRQLFYHLANLPTDIEAISKVTGLKSLKQALQLRSRQSCGSRDNTSSVSTNRTSSTSTVKQHRLLESETSMEKDELESVKSEKLCGQEGEDDDDDKPLGEEDPEDIEHADGKKGTRHLSTTSIGDKRDGLRHIASTQSLPPSNETGIQSREAISGIHTTLACTPSVQSMTGRRLATDLADEDEEDEEVDRAPVTPENSQSDVEMLDGESKEPPRLNISLAKKKGIACKRNSLSKSSVSDVSTTSSVFRSPSKQGSSDLPWLPTGDWVHSWKSKLPLQTIMRLLQVLVPQVEKICIDKALTDESEVIKFLQNGTLVGLLPVPHPILIRKYQPNAGTTIWFRNYMWGVIYLRNVDPPIWYDTNVRLFEIQRV